MKKKLEADLISIAHRILKLKNKSDINQLYLESQKLYEKLSVLRFVDMHYADAKPTIGYAEIEKEIESFFDSSAELPVEEIIEMTEINLVPEVTIEETKEKKSSITKVKEDADHKLDEVEISNEEKAITVKMKKNTFEENFKEEATTAFKSAFELTKETEIDTVEKPEVVQISFEDLLGGNYNETLFVKVDDVKATPPLSAFEAVEEIVLEEESQNKTDKNKFEKVETKTLSLNDTLSKGIHIDLNDQIAFVKHLFGNSNEDYNRVLNQLITFDNFYETRNFIEEMVKPDYNNWEGKQDYEERFMGIIEKKFL